MRACLIPITMWQCNGVARTISPHLRALLPWTNTTSKFRETTPQDAVLMAASIYRETGYVPECVFRSSEFGTPCSTALAVPIHNSLLFLSKGTTDFKALCVSFRFCTLL